MPEKRTYDAQGNLQSRQPLYKCTELYLPHEASELGVLNVSHFDLDKSSPGIDSTGLLSRGWQIYASEDNLYVAMSNRGGGGGAGTPLRTSHSFTNSTSTAPTISPFIRRPAKSTAGF